MINTFTFDGVTSTDFGLYISGYETFAAPKKVYKFINIPNRNGALLTSERRMENIEITYHCVINSTPKTNIRSLASFLLSRDGYCELSDTYNTTDYRKAVFEGPIEPEFDSLYNAAEFDLTFNCMPQRWLNSGKTTTTVTNSNTWYLTNPSRNAASPMLRVYGYGTLWFGSNSIQIDDYSAEGVSYVDIDCDIFDSYNGYVNLNKYVYNYVTLPSGTTAIHSAGSITKYEITPRWWTV